MNLKIYTFEIIHSKLLIYVPHQNNLNQYRTQKVHAISARGLEIVRFPIPLPLVWSYLHHVYVVRTVSFEMTVKMIKFLKLKYNLHL
jgi:hypothetical protein